MNKSKLIKFLKHQHQQIEDVLCALGEIDTVEINDPDMTNFEIMNAFSDALMLLEGERYEELAKHLEQSKARTWVK